MTAPTITCMYSCNPCGLQRVKVEVEARSTETVIEWMDRVCLPALVRDHAARSPLCHPKLLTELMIPITGASKVGGPAEN